MIFSSACYLKPCEGLNPPKGVWTHISGTDFVRDADGELIANDRGVVSSRLVGPNPTLPFATRTVTFGNRDWSLAYYAKTNAVIRAERTAAIVGVAVILAAGTTTTLVINREHLRRAADSMAAAGAQNGSASAHSLQGRWKGSNTAHPGQECTVDISGDKIEYRGADPNDWLRGTFVLNENANPKQIDVTILEPARSFIHCIYQAGREGITIAAAEHGSSVRPVGFAPGPQVDVLELQRD